MPRKANSGSVAEAMGVMRESAAEVKFADFSKLIAAQFQKMSQTGLYRVAIEKDKLWEQYLSAFPAGSNPVYKERTEHDCQCCRHFIRAVGGVVTIVHGELVTLWDVEVGGGAYQVVADAMAELVRSAAMDNVFLTTEPKLGAEKSLQRLESGVVKTWNHFYAEMPRNIVVRGMDIGPKLSDARATHDVLLRGLQEIALESIYTVQELIAQNSLYRGEEHTFVLAEFLKLKLQFERLLSDTGTGADLFAWQQSRIVPTSVSRIRNTVIGTLLTDLSEGKDLDEAVKAFELKVAPANYKRPTALVTKAMIQKAKDKIEELGFTSALERRYATIEDITVNNILFADRSARRRMATGKLDNIFEELAARVPEKLQNYDKVEEVAVDKFITELLPRAEALEIMFENRHAGNLVSLIAPVDAESKPMFKWGNRFSWSYAGDVADSIKERVKKAGGRVEGDLCCRLAWDYADDLDFHMSEPGGSEIYFRNRRWLSPNGGVLDLDANGADGPRPDPAENIVYADKRQMREGTYKLWVNNYQRRSTGQGFEVEVEFDAQTYHFAYEKALRTGENVDVAEVRYSKQDGFKVMSALTSLQTSKQLWGLQTQGFVKVNVVMLSPNHWDDRVQGNRHWFFMLDGCRNEGTARGFYNEFLREELTPHRKVFEMVGARMKTEDGAQVERQLSGLGFSSTQRNSLLCRVKGAFERVVKVKF